MPVVSYTNFLGRVVREDRAGTVRDYGRDTLGSTAALYDSSGSRTDEFNYRPYGEVRSHVGSSPTPLTFVGTLGYFMDSARRYYVRARSYRADLGRWTTVDPLWPQEPAYGYAGGMPNGRVDPSGLSIAGMACRAVCWGLGAAICAAVSIGCAVGTSVSIGGLLIPCTAVIIAACAVGAGVASICSDICTQRLDPLPRCPTQGKGSEGAEGGGAEPTFPIDEGYNHCMGRCMFGCFGQRGLPYDRCARHCDRVCRMV
jgi:RHS repeat-associated protein